MGQVKLMEAAFLLKVHFCLAFFIICFFLWARHVWLVRNFSSWILKLLFEILKNKNLTSFLTFFNHKKETLCQIISKVRGSDMVRDFELFIWIFDFGGRWSSWVFVGHKWSAHRWVSHIWVIKGSSKGHQRVMGLIIPAFHPKY